MYTRVHVYSVLRRTGRSSCVVHTAVTRTRGIARTLATSRRSHSAAEPVSTHFYTAAAIEQINIAAAHTLIIPDTNIKAVLYARRPSVHPTQLLTTTTILCAATTAAPDLDERVHETRVGRGRRRADTYDCTDGKGTQVLRVQGGQRSGWRARTQRSVGRPIELRSNPLSRATISSVRLPSRDIFT